MCRHRTVSPNPVLVKPESFMETSWSAGALMLLSSRLANIMTILKHHNIFANYNLVEGLFSLGVVYYLLALLEI